MTTTSAPSSTRGRSRARVQERALNRTMAERQQPPQDIDEPPDESASVLKAWAGRLIKYWPLALVLAALGGYGGYAFADAQPVTYSAEARVAVGYGDLSAGAIAGFPLAASDLASNYARYVSDQSLSGDEGVELTGTPISQSNVIRIIAQGKNRQSVVDAADQAAQALVAQVNDQSGANSPSAILDQFTRAAAAWSRTTSDERKASDDLNKSIRTKQSAATIGGLRQQLSAATSRNAVAELQKDALSARYQDAITASAAANLIIIRDSRETGSDRLGRLQRFSALGTLLGLLVALMVTSGIEETRGRRRDGNAPRATQRVPVRSGSTSR